MMDVLFKIDALRQQRGWSVNNLAMRAGLTQSTLNNLYNRNAEPKLSTLRAICEAFGITLAEFFREGEGGRCDEEPSNEELLALWSKIDKEQQKALLCLLRSICD